MPSDQPNFQQPTEEEALAAFFAACAVAAFFASRKGYRIVKARKLKKKLETLEAEKHKKIGVLDMKAIHEEWNV